MSSTIRQFLSAVTAVSLDMTRRDISAKVA